MKMTFFGAAVALVASLFLGGCSDATRVAANQYGVKINGEGATNWAVVYNNENMVLSNLCSKHCDRAHLFDRSTKTVTYPGKYIMPLSGDLELELDVELKITLRDDPSSLPETLKYIAASYPSQQLSPRVSQTDLGHIVHVELSEAKVKDFLRPILAQQTIETVMADVTGPNRLKNAALQAFNQQLGKTPVRLLELNFKRIGWPESITNKKTELAGMSSQREIEIKQLANDRLRETERQAFRIQQALNDLEIDGIYRESMSPEMLAWQWVDTANRFAESGTPFVLHPSMLGGLTPDKVGSDKSHNVDVNAMRQKYAQRLAELDKQGAALKAEVDGNASGN